jgi:hypothetical protein
MFYFLNLFLYKMEDDLTNSNVFNLEGENEN